MSAEYGFKFTIQRARQESQEIVVRSTRVVAGSAAHCEVRLDESEAAPEQLLFEVMEGAVFARSKSRQHGVLLEGVPFNEGPIDSGATIALGQTCLRVEVVESKSPRPGARGKASSRSLVIHAAAIIGFPVGLYLIFETPPAYRAVRGLTEAPPLFEKATSRCPQRVTSEASMAGDNEAVLAEAKRERSPFYPEDGVDAVAHYQAAAACYRVANESERATAAESEASTLKRAIQDDFHVHRARLDYALATHQYGRARNEVKSLLAFLGPEASEYKVQLKWLDHQIQLKYRTQQERAQ